MRAEGARQALEDLDIESPLQALAYLREVGLVREDESPDLHVLKGGVSNRTLLVEPLRQPAFVLKQALSKLRVAVDWYSDPLRIHREALGLRYLEEISPVGTITPLLFEDTSRHIIAMAAVPRPHRNWKEMLLSEGPVEEHVLQFAEIAGTIHRESARLAPIIGDVFADRSWFESLRLEPYYEFSATQVPEAATFLRELVEQTLKMRLALVHGDYSPKNILVHDGRLVLIDHEVVHFGDPSFDVGFSLTHLLSKAHHCRERRQAFLESAELYVRRYMEMVDHSGFDAGFESRACRQTLGCLLGRVVGRSPLEYLSVAERGHQKSAVLNLIRRPPAVLLDLIREFGKEISCL